jgi:hypothetical protein
MKGKFVLRDKKVFLFLLLLLFAFAACDVTNSPVVSITSPQDMSTFTSGDPITFTGTAADVEDGDISGDDLVWDSDTDGLIGTGNTFTKSDLSEGDHIISLTAIDADGNSGEDFILITIESNGGSATETQA